MGLQKNSCLRLSTLPNSSQMSSQRKKIAIDLREMRKIQGNAFCLKISSFLLIADMLNSFPAETVTSWCLNHSSILGIPHILQDDL